MPWWRRKKKADDDPGAPQRSPDAPPAARAGLSRGEQLLASAQEDATGHWLVLTDHRLLERTEDGTTLIDRPWHEVDTGTWDPDLWLLTVAFVDHLGGRQWQLRLRTGPGSVPKVLWERTTASVVLTRSVDLGPRRTARVSIRKDLAARELFEQVLLGRGSHEQDAELMEQVASVRGQLREQVGLPPVG